MSKPFFHTQSDKVIDQLIESKATIGEIKERFQQPEWCTYPDALEGSFGCWSLMDLKGIRHRISKPFCRSCECFKKKIKTNHSTGVPKASIKTDRSEGQGQEPHSPAMAESENIL